MPDRRVRPRMHFLELLNGHPRVNLSGGQVGMAQHHLDVTDIRAVFQHLGGHGVAKQVAPLQPPQIGTVETPAPVCFTVYSYSTGKKIP